MDEFAGTLLAELSPSEVGAGLAMEVDTVEARCAQLVGWGNLVTSVRDARVATVADYLKSRSRYQISSLGGRVHRYAREVLSAVDGAREVTRELLGQIADHLDRVLAELVDPAPGHVLDAEQLAGEVTSLFAAHRLFNDSVADFYAYLATVLSRYDTDACRALDPRRYPLGLEPVGAKVEKTARSTSKSAVSRRFVAATETALAELLAADLSGWIWWR